MTGAPSRGDETELRYEYAPDLLPPSALEEPSMWRYAKLLPLAPGSIGYPLRVGGTPLVRAPRLRSELGTPALWLKDETRAPSGSNKDRATALIIEDGMRRGARVVTTASTGNAAFATCVGAAATGFRAVVFVPPTCEEGKVQLMQRLGATVVIVRAGYAAAVAISQNAARAFGWLDRNTGRNPLTTEAKKTVAFEIWEQLGRAVPEVVVVPVGDGVTFCAMEKGFREIVACGGAPRVPRLLGVQAACCQPLVQAWAGVPPESNSWTPGDTSAQGIAVPSPAAGGAVLEALRRTSGSMVAVDEGEIAQASRTLVHAAGMLVDPAAAAGLAGLRRAIGTGVVEAGDQVVLLITGRAPLAASDSAAPEGQTIQLQRGAELDDLAAHLDGELLDPDRTQSPTHWGG